MTIEGRTDGASGSALEAVAGASRALTTGGTLREALASIAAAAASATGAEVVVARVLAADARQLKAHAVWAVSPAVLLWRAAEEDEGLELLGSFGLQAAEPEVARAGEAAGRALAERQPVAVEAGTPTNPLGGPPGGALQLLFAGGHPPSDEALAHLSTFGVRVADALRAGERARSLAGELERTRTLLGVVGQAIAQLSLAHTLETAVGRVAELLGAERLAVYLRDDGRLGAAAGRGLAGPHVRVAERLLELALGPYRGRGILVVEDAAADPQLAPAADAVAEAGVGTP